MKTYLTEEQFVERFWQLMEQRLDKYDRAASQCDTILWNLFKRYEKDIKETLEGAMYGIDEFTGDNANDLIGYQFHKSFRQCDIISDPAIDSVIWSCIQDAPVFWKCMEKACKTLTSKDLADDFIENGEFV